MKLAVPLAPLGPVAIDALVAALPGEDDPLWDQFAMRRQMKMHAATRTIAIVWGDWIDGFDDPVIFEPDYTPEPLRTAAKRCGERLVELVGGGTVSRLMLVDLPPGTEILPHRDIAPIITVPHRCHVPIETNAQVSFTIDDVDHRLEAGQGYEFDNTRQHAVANLGATRRIHLICDIMPPAGQRGA